MDEHDGRERVVSDTARTPAELRREQITALRDAGWRPLGGEAWCSPGGGTRVTVGPAEREHGEPALTRTVADGC